MMTWGDRHLWHYLQPSFAQIKSKQQMPSLAYTLLKLTANFYPESCAKHNNKNCRAMQLIL